jgi:hypothetical protein
MTEDSFTGNSSAPLTLNRYIYADDNPMALVDSSGHLGMPQSTKAQSNESPNPFAGVVGRITTASSSLVNKKGVQLTVNALQTWLKSTGPGPFVDTGAKPFVNGEGIGLPSADESIPGANGIIAETALGAAAGGLSCTESGNCNIRKFLESVAEGALSGATADLGCGFTSVSQIACNLYAQQNHPSTTSNLVTMTDSEGIVPMRMPNSHSCNLQQRRAIEPSLRSSFEPFAKGGLHLGLAWK